MGGRLEDRIAALKRPGGRELNLELIDVLQYRKEGPASTHIGLFRIRRAALQAEELQRGQTVKRVGQALDEADPIPHSYYLEVSSPGVERPLKKKEDYIRFRGRTIKLRTYAPIDGRRNFHGLLQGLEGDRVILQVDKEQIAIPLEQVAKAHLVLEF